MEALRDKIKVILEASENKSYLSHTQVADMIIECLRSHKTKFYKECPVCASGKIKSYVLGHHYNCQECNFKF